MAFVSNTNSGLYPRIPLIDELRGLAIFMMVTFHFCYDLNYFGWTHFALLTDPFWINWRNIIVALFVFLSGLSHALSPKNQSHFKQRLIKLGASAFLITLVSYVLFQQRFIYFGVIHFFLVATLISQPLIRHSLLTLCLGLIVLWLNYNLHSPIMNPNYLNWIGLATVKPATEDYAPLIPWIGVFWIAQGLLPHLLHYLSPNISVLSPLALLGRHSLLIYLLHQPLLFLAFTLTHL